MSDPEPNYLEQLKGFAKEAAKTYVTTIVQASLIPAPVHIAETGLAIVKEMPVQYRREGGGPSGVVAAVRVLDPIKQAGEADRKAEQAARVGDHQGAGAQRFKELEALAGLLSLMAALPRRVPVPAVPELPAAVVPKTPSAAGTPRVPPGAALPGAGVPKLPSGAAASKLPPVPAALKLPPAPAPLVPKPPMAATPPRLPPGAAADAALASIAVPIAAAAGAIPPVLTPPAGPTPNSPPALATVPPPAAIQTVPPSTGSTTGQVDAVPADVNAFIQAMIRDEARLHTKEHFLNHAASQIMTMAKATFVNNRNLTVGVSAGVVDGKLRYVVTVSDPKVWAALNAAISKGQNPLPPGMHLSKSSPESRMQGTKLDPVWHVEAEGPAELLKAGAKGVFTGTSGPACTGHCQPFWTGELGAPPDTVIHTHIKKFAAVKGSPDGKVPVPKVPATPSAAKVATPGKVPSAKGATGSAKVDSAAAAAPKKDAKVPAAAPAAKVPSAGKVPSSGGGKAPGRVPSAAGAAATAAKKVPPSASTKASTPAPTVPKVSSPATIIIRREWR